MPQRDNEHAIANKLLIAMPDQGGGFFEKSVILTLVTSSILKRFYSNLASLNRPYKAPFASYLRANSSTKRMIATLSPIGR